MTPTKMKRSQLEGHQQKAKKNKKQTNTQKKKKNKKNNKNNNNDDTLVIPDVGEGREGSSMSVDKNIFGTLEFNIQLQPFDMNLIHETDSPFMGFFGKRRTGKTTALIDVLYNLKDLYPAGGMVISSTEKYNHRFEDHFHPQMLHYGWSDRLKDLIEERQLSIPKNHPYHAQVCVIDDMAADKATHGNDTLDWFAMNGRHLDVSVCITTQYPTAIDPKVRGNVDFAFIFSERNAIAREHLWYSYGSGLDKKTFFAMMDKYTDGEKHMCIVVDNVKNNNDIFETFYWFVADIHPPGEPYFDLPKNRKKQPAQTFESYKEGTNTFIHSEDLPGAFEEHMAFMRREQLNEISNPIY